MTERVVAAFVPLVDCAVLVAAREQGFAADEGIELTLVREPSWASLRDHLSLGHVDCAHALAPLPVALTLGVGHLQVDCVTPFVLGRGGSAITVSMSLFEEMQSAASGAAVMDPATAGEALAAVVRKREAPLTLGMVFPFSNHNFDLRYWLAAAGVHPDRDVRLVSIPPPLMVEHLRAGLIDGFCVGEPWNSLAVVDGLGCIVTTQSALFPRAVEKVLAVRATLADDDRVAKLLRALGRAAAWADDPAHHRQLAEQLARPEYLGVSAEVVAAALGGQVRLGAGRTLHDPDFMFFHRHAANVPGIASGLWAYAQMMRWGQLAPRERDQQLAAGVFRPDLYRRAVGDHSAEPAAIVPFDRVEFHGTDVSSYLRRLRVRTPFGEIAPRA